MVVTVTLLTVTPYRVIENGRDTTNMASSVYPLIADSQMILGFANCTAGAVLQTPAEQLVNSDPQTKPTLPQLLKSSRMLMHWPSWVRTSGASHGTVAKKQRKMRLINSQF